MSFTWSDPESPRAQVVALTPFERGLAATVVLDRLKVLADVSWNLAVLGVAARLVGDAYAFARAGVTGDRPPHTAADLDRRFRELLGPDEDAYEEPPGAAAFLSDLLSLADHTVRVWADPDHSEQHCVRALTAAYEIAGYLEEEPADRPAPDLSRSESDRQFADLATLAATPTRPAPDRLTILLVASAPHRAVYADRFATILGR